MLDFLSGLIIGFVIPVGIGAYGAHHIKHHPEIVMSIMASKMRKGIRQALKDPPKQEAIEE
jgi:hypothetical protein